MSLFNPSASGSEVAPEEIILHIFLGLSVPDLIKCSVVWIFFCSCIFLPGALTWCHGPPPPVFSSIAVRGRLFRTLLSSNMQLNFTNSTKSMAGLARALRIVWLLFETTGESGLNFPRAGSVVLSWSPVFWAAWPPPEGSLLLILGPVRFPPFGFLPQRRSACTLWKSGRLMTLIYGVMNSFVFPPKICLRGWADLTSESSLSGFLAQLLNNVLTLVGTQVTFIYTLCPNAHRIPELEIRRSGWISPCSDRLAFTVSGYTEITLP